MLQLVPRTVAALLRPRVRKRPLTSLNRVRRRFRAAATGLAEPPCGSREQALRPAPVMESVVSGFFFVWVNLKMPLLKLPNCVAPLLFFAVVSLTMPFVVSIVDPIGM